MLPGKNSIELNPVFMYLVYSQQKQLGSGPLPEAARIAKEHSESAGVIVFDGTTFPPVDLDLSGSLEQVVAKANSIPTPENAPRRRGRPKLGVVSREVTLLPRHWEWLADQPGGISAAIRRLVANARKDPEQQKRYAKQLATEKAFRFCTAIAGDRFGYEEAIRALYADDIEKFILQTKDWPTDIASQANQLAEDAIKIA